MPAGVFGPPPVPGQNGGTDPYPAPWEPSPKKTPKAVAVAIAVGGCLVVAAAVFCMVAVGADVLARAADGFAQLRQEAAAPPTAGGGGAAAPIGPPSIPDVGQGGDADAKGSDAPAVDAAATDETGAKGLPHGWDPSAGYAVAEETFSQQFDEDMGAYGLRVHMDFDVAYPRFEGDFDHLDAANGAIRDAAMTVPDRYYFEPDKDARTNMRHAAKVAEGAPFSGVPAGCDALLSSEVDYAVTYNDDGFASIAFADHYLIGSAYSEYEALRCVNVDLSTGESFELDSVLTLTEDMANAWADDFLASDENAEFTLGLWGRDEFVRALRGEGAQDHGDRVSATFYVDPQGRIVLGVTFAVSDGEGSISRGWHDAVVPADVLEKAKKQSAFWDLVTPEA